ncbi:hypothetical protein ACIA5G_51005 [Amycolatopsis sp. NPDC051758]|uniref:hypothetical protein n=1 Tax=Amycolatopsis sp. NPDC051758 TaxID=3363935 RepID=UPI0037A8946C
MAEVERIHQALAQEGLSISEPGFLLPVYSNLGELAAALERGQPEVVHMRARALAAQFLLIAEAALTAQQRGDVDSCPASAGCADEPPF